MAYTNVGIGKSREIRSTAAGREAAVMALGSLEGKKADIAIVFSGVGHNQKEMLESIRQALPETPVIGCSAKGIIVGKDCDENIYSIGVMAIASDEFKFLPLLVKDLAANSYKAGETIGTAVKNSNLPSHLALYVFADGLKVNMKRFFEGFESRIDGFLPIFGGLAADNWQFVKTFQYFNNEVHEDAASCLLVSGSGSITYGVSHGCLPLGIDRTITKVQGNKIVEIDNKPAYLVFQEYLGEEETKDFSKVVGDLCFAEKAPLELRESYDKYIIRATLAYDPQENSVTIPTEIPEGTKIRMARRDFEKIVKRNKEIAIKLAEDLKGKKPKFVIYTDCAGRGEMLFGKECIQEVNVMRENVGLQLPFFGFYSYGEMAPLGKANYFHNNTAVVTIFY